VDWHSNSISTWTSASTFRHLTMFLVFPRCHPFYLVRMGNPCSQDRTRTCIILLGLALWIRHIQPWARKLVLVISNPLLLVSYSPAYTIPPPDWLKKKQRSSSIQCAPHLMHQGTVRLRFTCFFGSQDRTWTCMECLKAVSPPLSFIRGTSTNFVTWLIFTVGSEVLVS
jgi:hypothetical protein